jgi:ribose transport system permease protein
VNLTYLKRGIPAIYIPLVLLLLLNVWMNPNLLSPRGINNLFLQMTPVIFVVMAQTLALLVRELDISIGAMVSLSTVILASTMEHIGLLSVLLVCVIGLSVGAITGAIITYLRIPGIIVTLAMSMILGGIALMVLPQPGGAILTEYSSLVVKRLLFIPNSLIILLLSLLVWKYFRNLPLGQSIYATGGNHYSAFASGIRVHKAKIAAFMASGLLASMAGLIVAAKTGTGDATIGNTYTLTSIAGAILGGASFLGGIGSMRGAVGGAMVVSILVNILFFLGISSFYQYIVQGCILLIAVIVGMNKRNR